MDFSQMTIEQLAALQAQLSQALDQKATVKPIEKVAKNRTVTLELDQIKISPKAAKAIQNNPDYAEVIEKLAEEYVKLGMNTQPILVQEFLSSYRVQEFKKNIVIYLACLKATELYPNHKQALAVIMQDDKDDINECLENEALLLDSL